MIGAPDYELASVGLFFSCGDRRLLRRVLAGCGHLPSASGAQHSRRLLAYAILHRYSNLRWYLERLPVPGATTLEALAEAWFGL
jgi:hygromycin-B 7''-O-kinase